MHAELIIEDGNGKPAVVDADSDKPVTLGRHPTNTVVLHDQLASRWHAVIFQDSGCWIISNLGTPANGTRVNGELVNEQVELENGQDILIGNTRLRFLLKEDKDKASVASKTKEAAICPSEAGMVRPDKLGVHELTLLCDFLSSEETEPRSVVRQALELALAQTNASFIGFLSLDPKNPLPKMILPEKARINFNLSRFLTQKAEKRGQVVWLAKEKGKASESLLQFTDAMCIPALANNKQFGALHLYQADAFFTEQHKHFCEALAGFLAKRLHFLRDSRSLAAENSRLRNQLPPDNLLVGRSKAMQRLREIIERVAPRSSNVLVQGESGVGKELVAVTLHRQSPRHEGPLVTANCAAISRNLFEAELFGHAKGAFTGADSDRPGLFQMADGGTLFLDEIGELSLKCQGKLLRIIEGHSFRPVGGTDEIRADVRVIAATNRNLELEVKKERFRQDLLYRLQVIQISVPPLRGRLDDIPLLVEHFLGKLAKGSISEVKLTDAAYHRLKACSWPGNVRQLWAVLENAIAMTDRKTIEADDLSLPGEDFANDALSLNLESLEKWAIQKAVRQTNGNISQAAKILGIVRDTLASKLKKMGIQKE